VEGTPAGFEERVFLADVDPELVRGTPADERVLVRRVLHAPARRLERGPWEPDEAAEIAPGAFAVLLIDGLVAWDVTLAGRVTTVLLGPGDVITPWTDADSLIESSVRYLALTTCRVAALESRFLLAARRWPSLFVRVHERLAAQARRAAVDAAVSHLPNAELRVLGLLWHLADRWGRMGPTGVIVPLKLTHEALGRMIGAERPTVTLALRDLARTGTVERRTDGGWLLRHGSQAAIAALELASAEPSEPVVATILEPLRARTAVEPGAEGEDAVFEFAARELLAFAGELRDSLEHGRERLGDLLLQNREIVASAQRTRAEIAERRLRQGITPARRAP